MANKCPISAIKTENKSKLSQPLLNEINEVNAPKQMKTQRSQSNLYGITPWASYNRAGK